MSEDSERTGCIEANTLDGIYIDVILRDSLLDAIADTSPNIRGRLFLYHWSVIKTSLVDSETNVVSCLWLPQANVFRSQSNDVTFLVDYTSSCAASTYVNTNEVILLNNNIVARIVGV